MLSPQLFNIFGEHIIREALKHRTGGISIGGRRIFDLQYADDTTLIASDKVEMAVLVNLVKIARKTRTLYKCIKSESHSGGSG